MEWNCENVFLQFCAFEITNALNQIFGVYKMVPDAYRTYINNDILYH